MEPPSPIDDRLAKLCVKFTVEIIGQGERGTITLEIVEQSLAEVARHIRREAESA